MILKNIKIISCFLMIITAKCDVAFSEESLNCKKIQESAKEYKVDSEKLSLPSYSSLGSEEQSQEFIKSIQNYSGKIIAETEKLKNIFGDLMACYSDTDNEKNVLSEKIKVIQEKSDKIIEEMEENKINLENKFEELVSESKELLDKLESKIDENTDLKSQIQKNIDDRYKHLMREVNAFISLLPKIEESILREPEIVDNCSSVLTKLSKSLSDKSLLNLVNNCHKILINIDSLNSIFEINKIRVVFYLNDISKYLVDEKIKSEFKNYELKINELSQRLVKFDKILEKYEKIIIESEIQIKKNEFKKFYNRKTIQQNCDSIQYSALKNYYDYELAYYNLPFYIRSIPFIYGYGDKFNNLQNKLINNFRYFDNQLNINSCLNNSNDKLAGYKLAKSSVAKKFGIILEK